jgi:hypothetical protein
MKPRRHFGQESWMTNYIIEKKKMKRNRKKKILLKFSKFLIFYSHLFYFLRSKEDLAGKRMLSKDGPARSFVFLL